MKSKSLAANSVDTTVQMVVFIGILATRTATADSTAVGTDPIIILVKDRAACLIRDNT